MTVFNYGECFGKKLNSGEKWRKIWNIQDKSFLKLATRIESGGKIPTDKQAMRILQVLEKARLESFPKKISYILRNINNDRILRSCISKSLEYF